MKVYDLLGREVAILVDEEKLRGNHKVTFAEKEFSSGIYFYTLQSGKSIMTKKIVLGL